jgi:tetratricopeptide (TPR) repeat protein
VTRHLDSTLLAAALALAACAGPRPRPPAPPDTAAPPPEAAKPADITFPEPLVIEATPDDRELAGKNDEELFAVGTAAFAAGEYARAAAAFARLADQFPGSRRHATALYDAGLAYEQLSEWRLALERFRALRDGYTGRDADEAAFRVAECLWHLGELEEARAELDRLAARTDLEADDRVRALVQRGVVEVDLGRLEDAERTLHAALDAWRRADEKQRLDEYHPAQAHYYLGEVYRGHFLAVKLDPSRDDEAALAAALERKAQLLLAAQGHYLRAIQVGNPDWGVAAGYRIGELYDALHRELTEAPLPRGLDEEHRAAYQAQLRDRVRVLVTKAIAIYENTVQAAQRTGVSNRFVEEARGSLERMKAALDEAPSAASGR